LIVASWLEYKYWNPGTLSPTPLPLGEGLPLWLLPRPLDSGLREREGLPLWLLPRPLDSGLREREGLPLWLLPRPLDSGLREREGPTRDRFIAGI